MGAIDARIEHTDRRCIAAGPNYALGQAIRPCVLFTRDIVSEEYRRVVGAAQLGNSARGEQL